MTTWQWADDRLSAAQRNERPLIVDSWITDSGHTRALEMHFERFSRSCQEVGLASDDLPLFLDAVVARLPREGRHFPRIECSNTGDLSLLLRPAPPESREAVLHVRPDTRQAPQWKGPDLPHLLTLREQANTQGATDALLVDSDGFVVEAATAAVLWWEGDTLMSPDSPRVMHSVTATLVRSMAADWGVPMGSARRTPEELSGYDVWCLNAVHPVRRVSKIIDENQDFHIEIFSDAEVIARANRYRSALLAM